MEISYAHERLFCPVLSCPVRVESPVLVYLHPSVRCGGDKGILWSRSMVLGFVSVEEEAETATVRAIARR
jgi:hypothetical protein